MNDWEQCPAMVMLRDGEFLTPYRESWTWRVDVDGALLWIEWVHPAPYKRMRVPADSIAWLEYEE